MFFCSTKEFGLENEPVKQRKFIVYEANLRSLMKTCFTCLLPCFVYVQKISGSMIVLKQQCPSGHTFSWSSQPTYGTMPAGNLHLAASVLFSGSTFGKVQSFMSAANIANLSSRSYFLIQASYLIPAVSLVTKQKQNIQLAQFNGKMVTLGGDGRCCSPGHTAEFGSYSIINIESGEIMVTQLVKVHSISS